MPEIEKSSVISARAEDLFAFFLDPQNLSKITPPTVKLTEVEATAPLAKGALFSLRGRNGWVRFRWHGRVVEMESPKIMVDEQLKGPFRSFRHTHRFRAIDDRHTLVIDHVEYQPRFGIFGKLANAFFIRRKLRRLFEYRHRKLKELFEPKTGS